MLEQSSTIKELAVFLLAGLIIFLVIAVLLLLWCATKCTSRFKRCFNSLHEKLFYGTFIRYFLVSSLKL